MKNLIHQVMKVADIWEHDISESTRNFLIAFGAAYEDKEYQNEHLYAVHSILDDPEAIADVPKEIIEELTEIARQMGEHECAYLRMTTN